MVHPLPSWKLIVEWMQYRESAKRTTTNRRASCCCTRKLGDATKRGGEGRGGSWKLLKYSPPPLMALLRPDEGEILSSFRGKTVDFPRTRNYFLALALPLFFSTTSPSSRIVEESIFNEMSEMIHRQIHACGNTPSCAFLRRENEEFLRGRVSQYSRNELFFLLSPREYAFRLATPVDVSKRCNRISEIQSNDPVPAF